MVVGHPLPKIVGFSFRKPWVGLGVGWLSDDWTSLSYRLLPGGRRVVFISNIEGSPQFLAQEILTKWRCGARDSVQNLAAKPEAESDMSQPASGK